MGVGLYDLDKKNQKVVINLITSGFRKNGCKRVPVRQEEFVLGFTNYGIHGNISDVLSNQGIQVECTPEDAFYLYDDLMR